MVVGYLLPIINKLLVDKELLSKPPYALVLLPSIELCHQVSSKLTKIIFTKILFVAQPKEVHHKHLLDYKIMNSINVFQSNFAAETKKNYCKDFF